MSSEAIWMRHGTEISVLINDDHIARSVVGGAQVAAVTEASMV
jgi:hypothetical protein